jgi:hypothetical protein
MRSISPQVFGTVPEPAPDQLILGEVFWVHIRSREAHHRDFPEIRAQGGSTEDAVENLTLQLMRVLDTAITSFDREGLERALSDVRGFVTIAGDRDGWSSRPHERTSPGPAWRGSGNTTAPSMVSGLDAEEKHISRLIAHADGPRRLGSQREPPHTLIAREDQPTFPGA